MTVIIFLLIASVVSSILVIAAGVLSSRIDRRERYVENYFEVAADVPGSVRPEAAE